MPRDYKVYLEDIVEAVSRIETYISGKPWVEAAKDFMTFCCYFERSRFMKGQYKIFAAAFILLAGAQALWAAGPTYPPDTIAASAEWTQDRSPYVIASDVTVAPGAVLTIDPGVEVRFASPAASPQGPGPNLRVKGALRALGN
ncbi:MAG TPA: hypothetical protein VMV05_03100, partial [bacterium]|nr:hypothetical protein [bacterium]